MASGCGCPLASGTFCAVSQKCTRTLLGCDMEFGCFFLVLLDERGAASAELFLVCPFTQWPGAAAGAG